jgi:uncharacterized protein YjbJ (UPF0337 family)
MDEGADEKAGEALALERSGTGPRARRCTSELHTRRYAMAGEKDKVKGSLKEAAGKVTGDRRTEAEGKTDRAKGEAKDAAHHAKEGAKGVRDSLKKD